MPLHPLTLPDLADAPEPPEEIERLLGEAERRIDDFVHRRQRLVPGFVASDFRAAWAALQWITERHLLGGTAFCEWGCGFGVITLLAARLGLDACGVDVEPELIQQAQQLALDLEVEADFVAGSLIPRGGQRLVEFVDDIAHLDTDAADSYEELGLEIDDFDLIYAFPWPGEERFLEDLFEHYAADGALLLTYHGIEDLRLQRKRARRF